jgi:hypothetical protein
VVLSSNDHGWHYIFARCYCDELVAITSDRWTSHHPVATQDHNNDGCLVILPWSIATKGHNSQVTGLVLPCSPKVGLINISTCLQHDLQPMSTNIGEINFLCLLMSSFFKNLINSRRSTVSMNCSLFLMCQFFWMFRFQSSASCHCDLSSNGPLTSLLARSYCDQAHLPLPNVAREQPWLHVCPTLLAEIGRSHVKKFHTNFGVVQRHGECSSSLVRYQGIAGWFDITLEPDAYP